MTCDIFKSLNHLMRLSAIALCLLAVSCAEMEDQGPGITVVFKHGKLTGDPRVMQELYREFERLHPGVTVRDEILPSSTDQQHQFYAINLEGQSVPFDLMAVDVIWVQEFARAGWIRDLDGLIEPAEREAYLPAAIEAATFEGHLFAVPWYVDVGVLYYRRDLLERYGFLPPRTWPELIQIVQTILEKEANPALKGFIWQGKQSEGLVCTALEFVWGYGGDVLAGAGREAAALAFMRTLITEGISPQLVTTADEEATRLLFGNGRAIFMRNWPYAWSLFQQEGSPVRGKIGLAALPAFPGFRSASALGGWMLAIPSRGMHPELAGELLNFLTSPETQRRMAHTLGYSPARRELYTEPALREARPVLADLFPVFLAARPRPVTPYYLMLSQVMQPEFSAVVVGRKSAEAALASIRKQAAGMLELAQHSAIEEWNRHEARLQPVDL